MSRTWTARQPAIPDWLLGARRVPADVNTGGISSAGTIPTEDLEGGTGEGTSKDITRIRAAHLALAFDADVAVVPQGEADRTETAHPGPASLQEDSAEPTPADSILRKRFAPCQEACTTPPSNISVHVNVRVSRPSILSFADELSIRTIKMTLMRAVAARVTRILLRIWR